jgi:serine/threonine protein kinase
VAISDLLRLPPDVILVPVGELSSEVREKLTCDAGDFAITRPRARTPSRIVDADAAALLREFTQPTAVVEAVIRFARSRGASPETTLDEAYPLLRQLLADGFLAADGAADASGIHASLCRGQSAGKWEVVETVQVLEDTEIHQVRRDGGRTAALKIERPGGPRPSVAAALRREAAVLSALDGEIAPRLVEAGEHAGRPFLAIEWCAGVDAAGAARELRREDDRAGILALCHAVVSAYAGLHARGFVHGDVHPRNILIGPGGEARLIDFGFAVPIAAAGAAAPPAASERAGVGFFFEPELAAATLAHRPPPPASLLGEQYAVAALLYYLAAGAHYLDFSLEREAMLHQIIAEPPRPFAARGLAPWPEIEAVLDRALAKDPAARFPSLAAMAAALAEAAAAAKPGAPRRRAIAVSPARALLATVGAEVAVGGALTARALTAPTASLFLGAAGIACALYRLALLRDGAVDLAMADFWLARAEKAAAAPDAFLQPAKNLTQDLVGTLSPFHTVSGLAAMRALLANAQGNAAGTREASARFLRLALEWTAPDDPPAPPPAGTGNLDLTLGRSGVLLAAALLADVLPDLPGAAPERARLALLGGRLLDGLWQELDRLPPLARQPLPPNLGIAHGWAGYAFAALRFCRALGRPHPPGLAQRLAELAAAAEPWGRGLRWRWNDLGGPGGTLSGWCNGSAGFVHLFTLAHRELAGGQFLDLAAGAAWNAWEAEEGGGSLCCGAAGRSYALLALSRHLGGDAGWLARARSLADRAAVAIAAGAEKDDSLFKGRVGVALLAADLDRPDASAFPFFDDEGWRTGAH